MPTTSAVVPPRKNAWLSVLLLLVSTVFSLLAAEVIVRLVGAAPATTNTAWSPNIRVVEGPEFRYYVHTNSIGLRDSREFSSDSASTRVLFVGDSFTFGNGVSNNDTIAFKTEDILNQETGRSWTVINAGEPGTGTWAEERHLKRILDLINVNAVVLFYFVDNDPYETYQEYERERTPGPSSAVAPTLVRIRAIVAQHSALYRFLRLRLSTAGTLRAVPYTIFDQCDPAKLETFNQMDSLMLTSIKEMEQLTRERNLVFLVVLIPRREQISAASFQGFKQNYRLGQYPYDRFLPQKRVLEHVFRPEGIAPLDLMSSLEGLDPDKYYYRFDGHFNLTQRGQVWLQPKWLTSFGPPSDPKNELSNAARRPLGFEIWANTDHLSALAGGLRFAEFDFPIIITKLGWPILAFFARVGCRTLSPLGF